MKKISTFVIAAVAALGVSAQTTKGDCLLGGSFNVGFNNARPTVMGVEGATTNSFNFVGSPSWEKYYQDNMSYGLEGVFNYMHSRTGEREDSISMNTQGYQIAAFHRYQKEITDKLFYFGKTRVYGGAGQSKNNGDDVNKITSWAIGANYTPGFSYWLNEKIVLDLNYGSLGVQYGESEGPTDNITQNTSIGLDFSPSTLRLGMRFILCNK